MTSNNEPLNIVKRIEGATDSFEEPFRNLPDDNKSQLQKFGEELKKFQSANHGVNTHGACPRCGYCSSCGRSNPGSRSWPYFPGLPDINPLAQRFKPQLGKCKDPEY